MYEKGGPANIAGVDFETWFVALKLVDAFFDEDAIKAIELNRFFIKIPGD